MVLAPMSLLGWLIIGIIAGWLAGRIVKGGGFGLIGNMVVGILGACIGGYILPHLGIFPVSTFGDFVAATLGAVILLFVMSLVARA